MVKNIVKYIKLNLAPILVTLICIYALFLRLVKLYKHELWPDELWQLSQMKGTLLDLLKQLPSHEVCSYLSGDYYLVYPFFKAFFFNKWGLAIPHIILTMIGFYLAYLICKRYFKTIWGYLVTFVIICFNATLINHATEIRVYAVLPTLALASLYLAQLLIDNNFQLSSMKKIAIGMFFIMLIWFHAYGILIFSSTLTLALLNRENRNSIRTIMRNLFKFMTTILIIAMPLWLYSVLGPRPELGESSMSPTKFLKIIEFKMSVTDFIPSPLARPAGFLKAVFGNLVGSKMIYFLLLGVLFPFLLPLKNRSKLILFFITLVFMPIALIYALDTMVVYFFIPRQFVWVIPLFAIYLGWSWDYFLLFLMRRR